MEKLNIGVVDFQKYLICPKCHLIIENPFELKCCGTLYCYSCIQFQIIYKEKESCLKCGMVASYRPNSFVKRIVNGLHLTCNYGCGKTFISNEMKNHMKTCEKRLYFCNFCSDKYDPFLGQKKEFMIHFLEKHENEILNLNDNFFKMNLNYDDTAERMKKEMNSSIIEETKVNLRGRFHYNEAPVDHSLRSFDNYSNHSSVNALSDDYNEYDY